MYQLCHNPEPKVVIKEKPYQILKVPNKIYQRQEILTTTSLRQFFMLFGALWSGNSVRIKVSFIDFIFNYLLFSQKHKRNWKRKKF